MHLLQTRPGGYVEGEGIARIEQSPAPLVILSAADTDIALLAEAARQLPDHYPGVRLANLLHLRQHASVDLYVDEVLRHARVVVAAVLGGVGYWRYGVEQLVELAGRHDQRLILVPGDDSPDPELQRLGTASTQDCWRVWRYLREGGAANARALFDFLGHRFFDLPEQGADPAPLPRLAVYHPQRPLASIDYWRQHWRADQPVAAILFYRAHLQAGNTRVFDALADALLEQGLNPLPLALASLKDPLCLDLAQQLMDEAAVAVILNTMGFSMAAIDQPLARPFRRDVPVLQVILSGGNREDWESDSGGLNPRDVAMNVALPEVDGRIIGRAISFKGLLRHCSRTETDVVAYQPHPERTAFMAALAANWVRLGRTPCSQRKLSLVLANYPTRDGRIGNGVGLDTPASVVAILGWLQQGGYALADLPQDGEALLRRLRSGVTNDPDWRDLKSCAQGLALADYGRWFDSLPEPNRSAIRERWGEPADDPMVRADHIMVPGLQLGHVFVGIQPARGYHLDAAATYHDPDLVPTHAYLAFYCWLREQFGVQAIVHVGKHGNLEWLPGKGVALSRTCWPDLALGPTPHLYPFIVNDPGEGAQAKRRSQAVIIDHLVPPLTRAETYGPLRELERLVDEYYEALSVDPRRSAELRREIIETARSSHLHGELGFSAPPANRDQEDRLLNRMDTYLCELKESQIRDGLHILGQSPQGDLRLDTLLALARLPDGDGSGDRQSLLRALAADFGLAPFDPLQCDMAAPWSGPQPKPLLTATDQPWRTEGDTRERLELYARQLLATPRQAGPGPSSVAVLERIRGTVSQQLDDCGDCERDNLMAALEGRFVPPGPSGAPSRGRLDVLPTGRNFFSVDVRAIPTMTAWRLGFRSAALLLERHLQEHGEYPRALGISVWGTATMRTGGDDIAQALALMGVRPLWASGSNRVTDFEILPVSALDRPRVDVTLRVSGFFRDAFSNVIRFFDAAVQAVAALDEPEEDNPLRARVVRDTRDRVAQGMAADAARRSAGWRVFGSKPGSYGAGLQGLIDERCWDDRADLAEAYLNWGGYAYGVGDAGTPARPALQTRLEQIDAVLQNQDNREHDILDSDDYYQFQGGMTAAAEVLQGRKVSVYHADHAFPESPRIRTLKEEIDRVVRSRVVNPKWLAGVRRHGYKGGFEMAATVDYLFAYDATARVVSDYQYAMVSDAYLLDDTNLSFLQQYNPDALREMSERLLEAMQRGLWAEPGDYRERLEELLLDAEQDLEN